MTTPFTEVEQLLLRGNVALAVPAIAALTPSGREERLRVELYNVHVLTLSGFAEEALRRSQGLVQQVRDHAPELEVEALLAHARVCGYLRRDEDAGAMLARAADLTEPGTRARAIVLRRQALHHSVGRDPVQATQWNERAVEALRAVAGRADLALGLVQAANATIQHRDLEGASAWVEEAEGLLAGEEVCIQTAHLHNIRAQIEWAGGDVVAAEASLRAALEQYQELGLAPHQSDATGNLAEVLRLAGRVPEARELYQRVIAGAVGGTKPFFARLNLGLAEISMGNLDKAAQIAADLLAENGDTGWVSALLHLMALPAAMGHEARRQAHWRAGMAALDRNDGVVDRDLAVVLGTVAEHAAAAGELQLATRCRALELSQWERLGQPDEVERVEEALLHLRRNGARTMLGTVRLDALIGRGGMGEVWRGHGTVTSTDVAVKVLRVERGDLERASDALRTEVGMVAGLNHPDLVQLLDVGIVDRAAAAMSEGTLVEGTPWVAMELIRGGTLRERRGQLPWPQVRRILESLLGVLAHAHAQGLVHLDLKPANVLVASGPEGLSVRLSDFGIARVFRGAGDKGVAGGTPNYMAPEQFRGRWRDLGPWTDMYALGCLATELVTGHPPFPTTGSFEEIRDRHLHDDPPPLRAVVAVPVGYEAWLRQLMAKSTTDRFLRAADAAWALSVLDEGDMVAGVAADAPAEAPDLSSETWIIDDVSPSPPAAQGAPEAARRFSGPPFPDAMPEDVMQRQRGVGLMAFRTAPSTGHRSQRQALWQALGRAIRTEELVVAHVVGTEGMGVEGLCSWLVRCGHETGAATPAHLQPGERVQDLPSLRLGLAGLRGPALRRQLASRGRRWHLSAPDMERLAVSLEQGTIAQEVLLWCRAITAERPLLFCIPEGAARPIVRRLERELRGAGLPVLMVLGVDPLGDPANLPFRAPDVRIELAPASPYEVRWSLCDAPLDRALLHEVVEASEGSIEAGAALVRQLVDLGLIVHARRGLRRREAYVQPLPPVPSATWPPRLRKLAARRGADVLEALEVLAAFGAPVSEDHWRQVCMALSVQWQPSTPGVLEGEGWIRSVGGLWSTVVVGLRWALVEQLASRGRIREIQRACGTAVREEQPAVAGHLLVVAGAHEEARGPLMQAANRAFGAGRLAEAETHLRRWELAMRSLAIPESAAEWAEGWTLLAEIRSRHGDAVRARQLADRAMVAGRVAGAHALAASRLSHASSLVAAGRAAEAHAVVASVEEQAVAEGWADLRAVAAYRRMAAALRAGAPGGPAMVAQVEALQRELGDERGLTRTRYLHAMYLGGRGDLVGAQRLLTKAFEEAERTGYPHLLILCGSQRMAIHRVHWELAQARAIGEQVQRQGDLTPSLETLFQLNIAVTELGAGRLGPWRRAIQRWRRASGRHLLGRMLGPTLLSGAVITHLDAPEAEFRERLERARTARDHTNNAWDLAFLCEAAAGLAPTPQRARACAEVASQLWLAAGLPGPAARALARGQVKSS